MVFVVGNFDGYVVGVWCWFVFGGVWVFVCVDIGWFDYYVFVYFVSDG